MFAQILHMTPDHIFLHIVDCHPTTCDILIEIGDHLHDFHQFAESSIFRQEVAMSWEVILQLQSLTYLASIINFLYFCENFM